ncbi:MAG TPA: ABC transporter permease [Actinomycetota bacterium]|nr:ABC transporter permease [Actinomycetota bacterium]
MTAAAAQYAALSRRAIVNTVRQPTSIVPSLVFPLLFAALSSAALDRSTVLPGFPPVDSFLQFLISTTIVQGALFGAIAAGSDMATDIEGGFFERLVASPVARTSILVGRVMGSAMLGFCQAWLFIGVATVFGVDIEGGFVAMLMIAIVTSTVAAAIGAISVSFALRTGSVEAVQGSFPLLFVMLFVSSAFFPRDLMNGWFKTVADLNPLSHLIEGLRTQVIAGVDVGDWLVSLGVAAGLFAVGIAAASLALRRRLSAP